MKVVCKFKILEETKGAVRYSQTHENGEPVGDLVDEKSVGSLYIRKAKLSKPYPQVLTVTLEAD